MERRIKLRRGTAAGWTTADPIMELGEVGIETDTNKFKFGDGVTVWSGLNYIIDNLTSGPVTSVDGVSAIANDALSIAMTNGLQTALDNRVRVDAAQTLTFAQQRQARDNVGCAPDYPRAIAVTGALTEDGIVPADFPILKFAGVIPNGMDLIGQDAEITSWTETGILAGSLYRLNIYHPLAGEPVPTSAAALIKGVGLWTVINPDGNLDPTILDWTGSGIDLSTGTPVIYSADVVTEASVEEAGAAMLADLGGAALLNVGTTAGTVAAGNHTHVSADITDATSAATANKLVLRGANGEAVFGNINAPFNGTGISGSSFGNVGVEGLTVAGSAVKGTATIGVGGDFESASGYGVSAASTSSIGLFAQSASNTGAVIQSSAGAYNAEFGIPGFGDDRSFVARVLGAFGWWRGAYTGVIQAAATLTGSRTWNLPDADGTVALDSTAVMLTGDQTIAGAKAFSSATRPTSSGTGAPAATSLITFDDADSRYAVHYDRNLWPGCTLSASGAGASAVRTSPSSSVLLDGTLTTSGVNGSHLLGILSRGPVFGEFANGNAVDFRVKWNYFTRMRFTVCANVEILIGLGHNASAGKPTTGGAANSAGLRIYNNAGTVTGELWKQVAGTVTTGTPSTASPLSSIPLVSNNADILMWFENIGDGTLNCYMAVVADGTATPAKPTSPTLTISGLPSSYSSGYSSITGSMLATGTPAVNSTFAILDSKFFYS